MRADRGIPARGEVIVQIFARTPLLGQVKSRLAADIGARQSLLVYRALLARTLRTVAATRVPAEIWVAGSPFHPFLTGLARRYRMSLRVQHGADLGERMWRAMQHGLRRARAVILVGTDCPGLRAKHLLAARNFLCAQKRVVIGPSTDGGYYLIGATRAPRNLFRGIDWGTGRVLKLTRRRIQTLGLKEHLLTEMTDLDDGFSLAELASGRALLRRPIE